MVIVGLVSVLTIAVVAIVMSASNPESPSDNPRRVEVPDPSRRVTPSPTVAPNAACDATVDGTTAASVEAAVSGGGAGTVCFPAGRYEGSFVASVAGQTWQLDPDTVLGGSVEIVAPDVWIRGGSIELPTDDQWREGVTVDADRTTIQGVTFRGGGLVISVKGRDGTQVLDNHFSGQSGTAIFIWGEGRGADDTLIEGNTIDGTAARKASPMASRGAEGGAGPGVIVNQRITVRGNKIDQGDETTGWFGVEFKLSPGAVIVDNDIRGGNVLVSLPDSDGVIVSHNRLDLRGSATWGVEIAKSNDVAVEDNTFTGDGPGSGDTAVSMNSGSLRALISANTADGLGAHGQSDRRQPCHRRQLHHQCGSRHGLSVRCRPGCGRRAQRTMPAGMMRHRGRVDGCQRDGRTSGWRDRLFCRVANRSRSLAQCPCTNPDRSPQRSIAARGVTDDTRHPGASSRTQLPGVPRWLPARAHALVAPPGSTADAIQTARSRDLTARRRLGGVKPALRGRPPRHRRIPA